MNAKQAYKRAYEVRAKWLTENMAACMSKIDIASNAGDFSIQFSVDTYDKYLMQVFVDEMIRCGYTVDIMETRGDVRVTWVDVHEDPIAGTLVDAMCT